MNHNSSGSKIVYILADNRSGSTLLDQLLGAHDQIFSVGEIHHLRAYALQDRSLYNPVSPLDCSCGKGIADCPFWTSVERELGRSLRSMRIDFRFFSSQADVDQRGRSLKSLPKYLLASWPAAFRYAMVRQIFRSDRVAADSFALFDAIAVVSKARYIVDSSKSPFRFRTLYESRPEQILSVTLARDYRATIHSKMKRRKSLEAGAKSWALRMHQIEAMTADLPDQQRFRIRYEDLCNDPRAELGRLCDFLDLEFTEALLRRPADDVHHLGGSPSKFDPTRRTIQLDTSYRNAFSAEELAIMKKIVGPAAAQWGYD